MENKLIWWKCSRPIHTSQNSKCSRPIHTVTQIQTQWFTQIIQISKSVTDNRFSDSHIHISHINMWICDRFTMSIIQNAAESDSQNSNCLGQWDLTWVNNMSWILNRTTGPGSDSQNQLNSNHSNSNSQQKHWTRIMDLQHLLAAALKAFTQKFPNRTRIRFSDHHQWSTCYLSTWMPQSSQTGPGPNYNLSVHQEIGTGKMKTLWLLTCIPPPGLMGANFLNSSSSCAGVALKGRLFTPSAEEETRETIT